MLKILFFIENLGEGGAEKVLCNLVNGMDFSRFDITVQTLYRDARRYMLDSRIHYKWCYSAASKVNSLRMRAEAALGLTYPLHIRGDYDVEVAYLECGPTKIMSGSTNAKALKLAWVHCDLAKKAENPEEFAQKTAKYYQKYDRIVCVSEEVRKSFVKLYGDQIPVQTVYNCYDDANIREKAAADIAVEHPNVPLCVAVGRLTAQKSFGRLLHVHDRLIQEGIDHQLWILGEGPERADLEQYIREYHLETSVRLLGFQKNPYPYIQMSDFLVCSSLYEGFSTVAVEGMILGKTMVTTRCTGMDEVFGNSEYGLITENSEDGLYVGLKRMLTEQGLLNGYTEQAQMRGKDFSREKLVKDTESFFVTLQKEKAGAQHGR